MSSSQREESFDPSRRRLCPDGTCIGVLDESGRCKVCGRSGTGPGPAAAAARAVPVEVEDDDDDDDGDADEASDDGQEAAAAGAPGSGDFDARRRLCPDGACLGVLVPDGQGVLRCNVCGQGQGEEK